jgi:hypothetical protein
MTITLDQAKKLKPGEKVYFVRSDVPWTVTEIIPGADRLRRTLRVNVKNGSGDVSYFDETRLQYVDIPVAVIDIPAPAPVAVAPVAEKPGKKGKKK